MDDSNRTCAWAAVEPSGEGRREDGGVEEEEGAGEEIEASMADWMCHSQSVGRSVAWSQRAVTPAYKSALKMAPRRSSIAPVTT